LPSLYEPVSRCLSEHFRIPADLVTPDSTLQSLGLDSLAVVELMCVLQDDLGLRIPDSDGLTSLDLTLARFVQLVEAVQSGETVVAQRAGHESVLSP
jgi:acyl carrier protein